VQKNKDELGLTEEVIKKANIKKTCKLIETVYTFFLNRIVEAMTSR